nr:MAG TPA: hypothetical protein [Caudoviricetes sp.]
MEHQTYAVLVRTDEQNRIIEINSSAFVTDVDGWVQIDEGDGDRYHHAQGNYLPMPLTDDRGVYRYKLSDGHAVERTQAEMDGDYTAQPETPAPMTNAELEAENTMLKAQVKAVADRNEFVEDCIAEMATVVYADNADTTA